MKKILLFVLLLSIGYIAKSQSPCSYTYTVSGSTAALNYIWPIVGINSLDSVNIDFGDGSSIHQSIPVPSSATHTYASPGTYYVCLTRYLSSLANPGVPIPCTYCDSITIQGTSTPCAANSNYTATITGNSVYFSNTTTCGGCTSLFTTWIFGDGSPNSSIYNVTHVYANPGTYTACLVSTAINAAGFTCMDTFCTNITIGGTSSGCIANANFNSTVSGQIAAFTNSSTVNNGTISTYSWNFGDGSPFGTTASPTHTYAAAGIYNVCLTITGIDSMQNTCVDSFCTTITISSTPPPPCFAIANYSALSTGLSTVFNNTTTCTTCTSILYTWNFGDGSPTSNLMSPTHTYAAAGTYNVCLYVIAINANNVTCLDTFCSNVVVSAGNGCNAQASFTYLNSGLSYNFSNTSTCTNCASANYVWSFGDGSTSTLTSPNHTYATSGSYTVCLLVNGLTSNQTPCFDSTCKTITVNALGVNDIHINDLEVYPNPVSNQLNINLPDASKVMSLELVDITGRIVLNTDLNNYHAKTYSFNTSHFPNGVYHIKIQTSDGTYISKIIKR
jgi:PKD repeat protein